MPALYQLPSSHDMWAKLSKLGCHVFSQHAEHAAMHTGSWSLLCSLHCCQLGSAVICGLACLLFHV